MRAEAELALSAPRSAEAYRESLIAIAGETERLSRLVADLTLLAEGQALAQLPEPTAATRLEIPNPDDELGRLATTLNRLLVRIEAAVTQRKKRRASVRSAEVANMSGWLSIKTTRISTAEAIKSTYGIELITVYTYWIASSIHPRR